MSKTALCSLGCALLYAALGLPADAQTRPSNSGPSGADRASAGETVKKLGSVTWDLKNHKLVWVVQSGSIVEGKFVPAAEQEYSVSPDEAVMSVSEEQRGFAEEEATSLQHLLDILTVYCAESVVWWDQGQGTPVDGKAAPKKPIQPDEQKPVPGQKPVKVREQMPARTVPVAWERPAQ